MNHLVFLDTRAGELEKILSGVKCMVLKSVEPAPSGVPPVMPGDSLYFLRNNGELDVRVGARVVRAAPLVDCSDRDLPQTLKELQPSLQLDEGQYNYWSARRQVLLVEFESAHKMEVIHVAPNRIPDPPDWVAFGELREITEKEVAGERHALTPQPAGLSHVGREGGSRDERQDRS